MPAGYLIRRIRSGKYEVTKWGDSTLPEGRYTVVEARKGYKCNSPGCHRKSICKHAKLIKKWLKNRPEAGIMPARMMKEDGTEFGSEF